MITVLFAAALLAPSHASAAVLKLRGGQEKTAISVSVDSTSVILADGQRLPRNDVEEIRFAEAAPETSNAANASAAAAHGRDLFRQAAALAKDYPGVDGVALSEAYDATLHPDGTTVEHVSYIAQILKEGMKSSWGQVTASFEDGRSRARILKATVYEPDGRVYPLDASQIQVTNQMPSDALYFQDERAAVYQFPELQVGSIVEAQIETETYNPFRKDFFFPSWDFQDWIPLKESRFTITVPKGQKLYYATQNFTGQWKSAAKPDIKTKDNQTTYQWRLQNMPPIINEPEMLQDNDIAPYVKISLFDDWSRIYDWLSQMYEERTKPNPELAAFTLQLVTGYQTQDDKVAAIYRYVQKRVRYIAVKMGVASGWGGYDANLTWKRCYGCCIDKAILLSAMLRVIGVRSTPVLLDTNYSASHNFKVPGIDFEHAITHVNLDGHGMFLDSVGEDYRFPEIPSMDYGVKVLDVLDRKIIPVPVPKPGDNAGTYQYALTVSTDDGAMVNFSAVYDGTKEAELRGYYKGLKDSELKSRFEDWVDGISPSAQLISYQTANTEDLSKPFLLGWNCRLPHYLIQAGDLYIFKLPDLEEQLDFPEVSLANRHYGLKYHEPIERLYHYDVTLPANLRVESMPKPVQFDGLDESFAMSCKSAGAHLSCDVDFKRGKLIYSTTEYPAHKAFLDRVSRLTRERIFLKVGA